MVGESYPTSYFSTPSDTLDPNLFEGRNLRPQIRQGIVTLLNDFLNQKYRHPELWSTPWLAGSGVSYQWDAARYPADLDCLVGVHFVQFRKANPEYAGLSDVEISHMLNEDFHDELQLSTSNWNGYELTFYVNPGGADIRAIKPYAAYNLQTDEWTVIPHPSVEPPSYPSWENAVSNDRTMATQIRTRFEAARNELAMVRDVASRRNAETRLSMALSQAVNMFEDIHMGRSLAFSGEGEGYSDFHNYRWQAGKRDGTIQTLKSLRDYAIDTQNAEALSKYGVELPDTETLIRRAATYRKSS
jgi:hypothetical protein